MSTEKKKVDLSPERNAHDLFWRMMNQEDKEEGDTSTDDQRQRAKNRTLILIEQLILEVPQERQKYWKDTKLALFQLMVGKNVHV